MYKELSTVPSIQCSINDNYLYYICLMDGPVPDGVISQFIGLDILNENAIMFHQTCTLCGFS